MKPATVAEYLDGFTEPARSLLVQLRTLSIESVPDAKEGLKWGNPAYSYGTILFAFAGYKNHANFVFTPSTLRSFSDELTNLVTGKGSIQLPYTEPIPKELLKRMIKYRVDEWNNHGVTWM